MNYMNRLFHRVCGGIGLTGLAILTIAPLVAQEQEDHLWTASLGAGFTTPSYHTGTEMDTGWNISTGAGLNFFHSHLGLNGEFMFNSLGVNNSTLNNLGYPGGDVHVWAFTGDPVIRLNPHGRFDFYLTGGPGVYHRYVEFTAPTLASFTGYNPFLGVFYPVTVPANEVVNSFSTTKLGVNGGGGFTMRLGSGRAKFFAEARYNQMYTRQVTSFIPVTFGIKW
jgi:hypothetical protein